MDNESKVLVIYTGGTIGMLVGRQGYVPEPFFLTETLRSQNRFHDPLQDSPYSHSDSVEGFREWNNSGRSSPLGNGTLPAASPSDLLVRSSRPIGQTMLGPATQTTTNKQPLCRKLAEDLYEANLPSLVTPRSSVPGGSGTKRIRYAILEWNPLLDSSNIEIIDWIRIATEIELNYLLFDAFVVLHGTDTMTYTSSALTFLLEDLGKTVIITGAQIPLSQLRNDAVDNLLGALSIAGHYVIPECCLYFNHTLFRGNRVSKVSSFDFSAFSSPNFPPLVNVGIDIVVNWNDVIRQTGLRRFRAHKDMSPHVATLRLFPGITGAALRAFLTPPMRGVVLETYGAGNAPQRADLMTALADACARGVVVVAISQCAKGSVSDAYETGRTLLQAGVVPGADMTPECALSKLSYLLSKPEFSPSEVRNLMGMPLRGELTRPTGPTSNQPTLDENLDNIQGILSQFVRLSGSVSKTPKIVVTENTLDGMTQDIAKPWSWTAAEAVTTGAALVPFLVHLAAAWDDVESLQFCLSSGPNGNSVREGDRYSSIAGGAVNCLDAASGRSPLHVAALNGSLRCAQILLQSGALVHLRDCLGHTALYYAARKGHVTVVEDLMTVGANLGGADLEFAALAIQTAMRSGDQITLSIWAKAGMRIPIQQEQPDT